MDKVEVISVVATDCAEVNCKRKKVENCINHFIRIMNNIVKDCDTTVAEVHVYFDNYEGVIANVEAKEN